MNRTPEEVENTELSLRGICGFLLGWEAVRTAGRADIIRDHQKHQMTLSITFDDDTLDTYGVTQWILELNALAAMRYEKKMAARLTTHYQDRITEEENVIEAVAREIVV